MTKFYRTGGRQKSRRTLLVGIVALVVLGGAVAAFMAIKSKHGGADANQLKTAVNNEKTTKYASLGGGYVFSIPAGYAVDETLFSGVVVAYPEKSPPQTGMNLDQLYKSGVVAIQPIAELKNNDLKPFKDYVNNKLAGELKKTVKGNVDVRDAKQGTVEALKVFALAKDGKRLKAMYAIDYTRPILMVAADENTALKIIGSTTEELKNSKSNTDVEHAAVTTKAVLELIVQGNLSSLSPQTVAKFDLDDLGKKREAAKPLLDRQITIVGGSFNDKTFVAQFVFEPKTKDQVPSGGLLAFQKEGSAWKLSAVELPTK